MTAYDMVGECTEIMNDYFGKWNFIGDTLGINMSVPTFHSLEKI